ncbi:MAG: hypothetical protein HY720_15795 [Planctomycetes bacterium]|nr:hypothetical protein [Planctomycetota bacterium]
MAKKPAPRPSSGPAAAAPAKAAPKKGASPARNTKNWGIGDLAVYNRLLRPEHLEECRKIQAAMAEAGFPIPLGQILIEKYYLDQAAVRALIRARSEMGDSNFDPTSERVNIVKLTAPEHEVLVERIRAQKLVPPERIDQCFDIQCRLGEFGIDKQLGEILLERGDVPQEAIEDILKSHLKAKARLTKEYVRGAAGEPAVEDSDTVHAAIKRGSQQFALPENKRLLFGRIAVEKGIVPSEQVEECLFIQFKLKELGVIKRLGEVLVEKRYLQKPDVKRILALQKQAHGKIKWIDKNLTVSQNRDDVLLQKTLLDNQILGPEEVNECIYVQQVMKKLGLVKSLAAVIVDKEYLDKDIVRSILKEHRRVLEEAGRKVEDEKKDVAERSAAGFVFADVKLKEAYLDIIASKKFDQTQADRSQSGELRGPLRSRVLGPVVPRWVLVAAGMLLAGIGVIYGVHAGLQPRKLQTDDDDARPGGVTPTSDPGAAGAGGSTGGRNGLGSGDTHPGSDTRPGNGQPVPEKPRYLVAIERALAKMAPEAQDAARLERKETLAAAVVEPVDVPDENTCFFAFRAKIWLPPGAAVSAELLYRDSQPLGQTRRLEVDKDSWVAGWFGPFAVEAPEDVFAEFAHPWVLRGPYTLRLAYSSAQQEEEVRRANHGNPFLDASGEARADLLFYYPDPKNHEAESILQETHLTRRLAALFKVLSDGKKVVDQKASALRKAVEEGKDGATERNALFEVGGLWEGNIGRIRTALTGVKANLLAVPQPNLFARFEDLLLESEKAIEILRAGGDGLSAALAESSARWDEIAPKVEAYLGENG